MLQAAGTDNHDAVRAAGRHHERRRPGAPGCDPQDSLFTQHQVKVFVYNQQVTDSLTASFLRRREADGIPVVGVYETMPMPGYDYQSWMLAEVTPCRPVADTGSTTRLGRARAPRAAGRRGPTVWCRCVLSGRTVLDHVSSRSAAASSPG